MSTAATVSKFTKFVPTFEPEIIALTSVKGTPKAPTQYSGDQVQFLLTDGRFWYTEPYVAKKITDMMMQPGEMFEVFKTSTRRGAQCQLEVHIKALDPPETPPVSEPAPRRPVGTATSAAAAPDNPPMNGNGETSATHLARCYRDAVDVCLATLAYAKAKGLVIAPDFGDVRALAATICISETGRR